MNRIFAFVVALLILSIWWLGKDRAGLELAFENERYATALQSATVQDSLIEYLAPQDGTIGLKTSESQISAYQGIEVHLDALRWQNRWFDASEHHNVENVGGQVIFDVNKIIFDPDLPERGKPDLLVTTDEVKVFHPASFIEEVLGGYQFSRFLGDRLSTPGPYDTYTWNVRDDRDRISQKIKMERWLLEFPLIVRIQPAPGGERTDVVPEGMRHPVTGGRLDLDPEYENQRFGNLTLRLKFVPKSGDWYVAQLDEQGYLVPNQAPHIGIAAVECVSLKFEGDPEEDHEQRIGAYIYKGESLALHTSLDDFGIGGGIRREDVSLDVGRASDVYREVARRQGQAYLNPQLFGQEKYALVHVVNIGAWRRGNWLVGRREWADQITARFVIHAFIVGEWQVKRPYLQALEAPEPYSLETSSLWSRLLPDFGLGKIGRFFSGAGLFVASILLLAFFFPPVLTIVNTILRAIARLLKKGTGIPES